ncbi:MAG: peptide chain release factor-like protein [Deltaproteobacteria bacterium]|jgi:peptide chain release factor|nr:peptide chain release factor-like protein [Deltaproteobacteria bacterium]
MLLQISSGTGPVECELAVSRLAEALLAEFPETALVGTSPGSLKGALRSATLSGPEALAGLEGTVQWICQSPARPGVRRKNWFIDVSVLEEEAGGAPFSLQDVRYQVFRSPGKGGQNVNKVATGVRAVHVPTGAAAVSTDERSQSQNKETALRRLRERLEKALLEASSRVTARNRLEHTRLVRGNPSRVYEGPDFKRVS